MRCKCCGSKISDDARFCRYCGSENKTAVSRKPIPAPEPKRHTLMRVCVVVGMLLLSGGVIFVLTTGLLDRPEKNAEVVKNIDLKDAYTIENDQLKLGTPIATYAGGKKKALTNYKVYIDNRIYQAADGNVETPRLDAGEYTILLEWEEQGKTYHAEKKIEIKQDSAGGSGKTEENLIGNTIGNIGNMGYLAQQGDWYYYSQGHTIYKTKDMDKEGEKLCDARYASNLNVIGEWLYYICQEGKDQYNQVIRRMKTDGSNMEILYENDDYTCKRMVVVEDQIIFQTVSMDSMGDTETLYCMVVDGGEPTALLDEESYFYGIDGNYVYYFSLQMDENTIPDVCRMDLKTKKPEVVLEGDDEGGVATNLAIEDGWLYYAKATGGETLDLSRINLETGESVYITAIANTNYEGESPINVKDGWIYFNDVEQIDTEDGEGDTISKVMKVKADGSGETKVTDSVESASIFTCGDQVFCATADKKIFVWNEDDLHFNWERIPQ